MAKHSLTNFFTSVFLLVSFLHLSASAMANEQEKFSHEQWLKDRFSTQHEQLIPIVAVADMYFSCHQQKHHESNMTIKALITTLDKNQLAEKLIACLGDNSPKSDLALNYGLLGCFHEQLSGLSSEEKQQKMKLVKTAIASLSRHERQKSFTECVTDQSIAYLK